ncbi:MAG: hypothetical protein ACRYF3_08100 [Janthinobacterium lividum]
MKIRLRSTAAALVTVVSSVGLAGCAVFSAPTVLRPYEPSDGQAASIAGVDVRNALIVSAGADEPGVLAAVLVNTTEQDASVSVTADGSPERSFVVPAGQTFSLGDPTASEAPEGAGTQASAATTPGVGWLQIPRLSAEPGESVPLTFQVADQSIELSAPILLPCFEYATVTPTAGTSSVSTADPVSCGPSTGEAPVPGGEDD